MKFEQDEVTIIGGVRHGETQGGPVAIQVGNTEWPKWEKVMSADPVDPSRSRRRPQRAADPAASGPRRPGRHAEVRLPEARPDPRARLARETAARVALGRVATNFLEQAVGARIVSHVIELGGVRAPAGLWPEPDDVARLDEDPVRCLDPDAAARWSPRSTRPTRTATPSAASSRSSSTDCRRASAPTSTGTVASTPGWPAR